MLALPVAAWASRGEERALWTAYSQATLYHLRKALPELAAGPPESRVRSDGEDDGED